MLSGEEVMSSYDDLVKLSRVIISFRFGDMMMTVTAWEQAEHIRLFTRNTTHRAAVKQVFDPGVATSLMSSVWLPDRISAMVRCSACDQIVHTDRIEGRCVCGARLPEPQAYW
jgi:hypothetical protein